MGFVDQPDRATKDTVEAVENAGKPHGFDATAEKRAVVWYVVTRHIAGNELDRAYVAHNVDLAAVRADFAAWRRDTKPEDALDVAVEDFMSPRPGRRNVARHDGSSVLSTKQCEVLERLQSDDGEGTFIQVTLEREQIDALDAVMRSRASLFPKQAEALGRVKIARGLV